MNQLSGPGGAGDLWSRSGPLRGADGEKVSAEPIAVYVHIPFCPSKCGYCDFNSYAMSGDIVPRTAKAIRDEVLNSPHRGRPASTVFFGGGTPTFLPPDLLLPILEAVFEVHPPLGGAEVTSEANPGTVDADKFRAMRGAGFNRLSLGAQSFVDDELIRLERVHKASEIDRAVRLAREAGFDNLNLDLMFALPGQSRFVWERNLDRAIRLEPEHLSLYCLTLEENTKFYKRHLKGLLVLPEEDEQAEMYDLACRMAEEAGYRQYEISNFANRERECRHNLAYWRCREYAGYGPGAVGRVGQTRYTNVKHPLRYSEAVEVGDGLWCESEAIDEPTLRTERIMLGLRMNEGFDSNTAEVEPDSVRRLWERGWIEQENSRIALTAAGRHFCTEAAAVLI